MKSYYGQITRKNLERIHHFSMRQIWKTKVPPRITFFAWEACRECILTIDKLKVKGLCIPNKCYLCMKAEESCNHVLLWCPVAFELWSLIYNLLDINWAVAGSVREELQAQDGVHFDRKLSKMISLTIFWVLWKKRNSMAFEGKEGNLYRLKNRWMYYFGSILLEHDIISDENFGYVIDILTTL